MAGTDFFIRPASGTSSSDWVRLPNADISVAIARRMTRTVLHGGEGDDLVDEGAESAVYTVRGEMNLEDYKKVLKMFRAGQPYIHDPFEEREPPETGLYLLVSISCSPEVTERRSPTVALETSSLEMISV